MLAPDSVARSVRGRTVVYMADKPDLDEKFSLHPLTGEEVLKRLLDDDPTDDYAEDEEAPEGDDT